MQKAKRNDLLIDLNTYSESELKELKGYKDYGCPYCQKPVRLKSGPKRRAHFAHMTPCDYHPYENESLEHQMAKNLLAKWLQNQGIQAEMEYPISEIRRIADVYFEWGTDKYVLEIQKSPLTESMFKERTKDYESFEISVLWVFIGDMVEQQNTFILNRVMALNKERPIIHLQLTTEKMTFLHPITWISTKEIQAQSQKYSLNELTVQQLLTPVIRSGDKNREAWLEIKEEFRKYKWHAYMKQEGRLLQMCARYRTNLALLPAEVGWPVDGSGFRKSLFIWQAYILMSIIGAYEIGECFTLSDIIKKLKAHYRIIVNSESLPQLKGYLNLLIKFGVLAQRNGYYEYNKEPIFYDRLEQVLIEDQKLSLIVQKSR